MYVNNVKSICKRNYTHLPNLHIQYTYYIPIHTCYYIYFFISNYNKTAIYTITFWRSSYLDLFLIVWYFNRFNLLLIGYLFWLKVWETYSVYISRDAIQIIIELQNLKCKNLEQKIMEKSLIFKTLNVKILKNKIKFKKNN